MPDWYPWIQTADRYRTTPWQMMGDSEPSLCWILWGGIAAEAEGNARAEIERRQANGLRY